MSLEAFGSTDVGRVRTGNEDAFLCDIGTGTFVVCDGMGGHAAGEVASGHAVQTVAEAILKSRRLMEEVAANKAPTDGIAAALRGAIERACGELHAMGKRDRSKKGLGTTCTALACAGNRAVLAHVGDSRCYLLRQGQLTQLSDDHTYVAEATRAGLMTAEDAERSPFGNVVTRAVGPHPTVLVDVVAFDLARGDTVLLCSDGLHQYFKDETELASIVAGPNLEESAKRLIALANERGGSDNISVVLVRATGEAAKRDVSKVGTAARVDALRHVDLFQDLSMVEVIRLCQAFESIDVPSGEFLVREGDVADAFFVLVEGTADVYRGPSKVASLPKGSHFGEMSLLAQRPRTASVKATADCHLLRTRRDTLFSFLEREPMLAAKVFWKLANVLSLRLDDLYSHAVPAQTTAPVPPPAGGKHTMRFGSYPSQAPGPKR